MANHDVKAEGQGEAKAGAKEKDLPAIDFSTFVLSLSTTALYQMGLVPDPATGQTAEPDRTMARQTIDTLVMLRHKTEGNLEDEEDKLFASLLYELRMHFLKLGSDS
jgi:hypothetical protein